MKKNTIVTNYATSISDQVLSHSKSGHSTYLVRMDHYSERSRLLIQTEKRMELFHRPYIHRHFRTPPPPPPNKVEEYSMGTNSTTHTLLPFKSEGISVLQWKNFCNRWYRILSASRTHICSYILTSLIPFEPNKAKKLNRHILSQQHAWHLAENGYFSFPLRTLESRVIWWTHVRHRIRVR